ncbi:hypothetical protein ACQRXC_29610 (plasmid) [Niallia taxi]|uniref:hypothetical protein n=1 Tax=Niallia taxi TaxID=2499688 RepID=UPI003F63DDF2
MARKSEEERLLDMDEKIKKMQAEKQRLANQVKQKERKARTQRLIRMGGLLEKYLGITGEEETIKLIASFQKSILENKDRVHAMDINQARNILGIQVENPKES